jgi:hypothetical protein
MIFPAVRRRIGARRTNPNTESDLKMNRFQMRVVATLSALAVVGPAAAQQTGPVLRTGAAEITIGGRVHTQFTTSSVDTVPVQEWVLRRLRLESTVKVNDVVGGKISVDFAGNRVTIKDAYLTMELDPAFRIQAGNQHRPFGVFAQTSSNRIPFAERGARIRGLSEAFDEHNLLLDLGYTDRDLGLQISGAPRNAPAGLFYGVGYFNGPARRPTLNQDSYQLAARVGVKPLRNVTVAGSWSRRDFAAGDTTRTGMAWALDAEVGSYAPGFHFVGEVTTGDFDPFEDARFFGAQAWLAYRTREMGGRIKHIEPALRVSHGDPEMDDDQDVAVGGLLVTPGLNLYVGGMNRIMFNADFWHADTGRRENSFKTQFQLAF